MIFILIPIIFAVLALVTGIGLKTYKALDFKKTYQISESESKKLSSPAQNLLISYMELPVSSRPMGNIHPILTAMDVKYGVSSANAHFNKSVHTGEGRYSNRFGWNHGNCYHYTTNKSKQIHHNSVCAFAGYVDLRETIIGVQSALDEQARKFELEGVAGGLESATMLMEQLREERTIIETTTKEITS